MSPKKQNYRVAVPVPLAKEFTYSWNSLEIQPGTRVLIPFAGRKLVGVALGKITAGKQEGNFRIKGIIKIVDSKPLYSEKLLDLGFWLSNYYHHPLGEVLKAMIPQRDEKTLKKIWKLNPKNKNLEPLEQKILTKIFSKKDQLSYPTVQKKYKDLEKESLKKIPKLISFLKKNLVLEIFENKKNQESIKSLDPKETKYTKEPKLTEEQKQVVEKFSEETKNKNSLRPFLLHGITGSGKTEVYLNMIKEILSRKSDGQILVLVPEISLTPQMTQVFKNRFPEDICTIHSAMPENHRFEQVMTMHHNKKKILIGPRSAVFVPFHNLQLIIVDEEHDSSYKQNTQFSYHGKDTAIVRAHKLKIPIVLGSATPSAESYWNSQSKKYHLLELKNRVLKQDLPQITLKEVTTKLKGEVLLKGKINKNSEVEANENIVAPEILEALKENHKKGKQSIVIVNRRGYAYYLFDLVTKKIITCSRCSVSLTLHNQMKNLSCHYCQSFTSTEKIIGKTGHDYAAVGYGSQKAEFYLQSQIPEANIVRLDSDTARKREDLTRILDDFREEKIDILVGTQILAKGHDFPKVTLVVLLEVDKHLNLPDFRSGERTFQLMVQAAGRSGRSGHDGQVIIQTMNQENKVIVNAAHHNYKAFMEEEITFRKKYDYPPFSKIALLEFSSTEEDILENYIEQLTQWIESFFDDENCPFKGLKIQGPYSPGLAKINRRWRKHLLIRSTQIGLLHNFVRFFTEKDKKRPEAIRLKIDIDPQSLL